MTPSWPLQRCAGTNQESTNSEAIFPQDIATDTNAIRIGTKGTQTRALTAGICTSPIFGLPVVVNPHGALQRHQHPSPSASGTLRPDAKQTRGSQCPNLQRS